MCNTDSREDQIVPWSFPRAQYIILVLRQAFLTTALHAHQNKTNVVDACLPLDDVIIPTRLVSNYPAYGLIYSLTTKYIPGRF